MSFHSPSPSALIGRTSRIGWSPADLRASAVRWGTCSPLCGSDAASLRQTSNCALGRSSLERSPPAIPSTSLQIPTRHGAGKLPCGTSWVACCYPATRPPDENPPLHRIPVRRSKESRSRRWPVSHYLDSLDWIGNLWNPNRRGRAGLYHWRSNRAPGTCSLDKHRWIVLAELQERADRWFQLEQTCRSTEPRIPVGDILYSWINCVIDTYLLGNVSVIADQKYRSCKYVTIEY